MSRENWQAISPSPFPWEKEALDYVRAQFPSHEPYRAWSNFEFIADDGSINEVDLLVLTPQGFFLVEIKSNPGILTGDGHTWTWEQDGRRKIADNPLFLANLKAANQTVIQFLQPYFNSTLRAENLRIKLPQDTTMEQLNNATKEVLSGDDQPDWDFQQPAADLLKFGDLLPEHLLHELILARIADIPRARAILSSQRRLERV